VIITKALKLKNVSDVIGLVAQAISEFECRYNLKPTNIYLRPQLYDLLKKKMKLKYKEFFPIGSYAKGELDDEDYKILAESAHKCPKIFGCFVLRGNNYWNETKNNLIVVTNGAQDKDRFEVKSYSLDAEEDYSEAYDSLDCFMHQILMLHNKLNGKDISTYDAENEEIKFKNECLNKLRIYFKEEFKPTRE